MGSGWSDRVNDDYDNRYACCGGRFSHARDCLVGIRQAHEAELAAIKAREMQIAMAAKTHQTDMARFKNQAPLRTPLNGGSGCIEFIQGASLTRIFAVAHQLGKCPEDNPLDGCTICTPHSDSRWYPVRYREGTTHWYFSPSGWARKQPSICVACLNAEFSSWRNKHCFKSITVPLGYGLTSNDGEMTPSCDCKVCKRELAKAKQQLAAGKQRAIRHGEMLAERERAEREKQQQLAEIEAAKSRKRWWQF